MLIDMSHHDGKIEAAAKSWPTFTTLTFRQGRNSFILTMPRRMAAVAAMIEEAFNAHSNADPATIVAQGGEPVRHDIPADRFGNGGDIPRPGTPAMDAADPYAADVFPPEAVDVCAVGGIMPNGSIRITDDAGGFIRLLKTGRVYIAEEMFHLAMMHGWRLSERADIGQFPSVVAVERGAVNSIRILGENAVTGGASEHVG